MPGEALRATGTGKGGGGLSSNLSQQNPIRGSDQRHRALSPERVAGSGSGPRTVASPPTPELHIPVAPPRFWLAPRASSARKGVARLALGGWAVEGVHVDSLLASLFNSYQDPPRPGSSGFFHPDQLLRLGVSLDPKTQGPPVWDIEFVPRRSYTQRPRLPRRFRGAGKEAEAPVGVVRSAVEALLSSRAPPRTSSHPPRGNSTPAPADMLACARVYFVSQRGDPNVSTRVSIGS